jgi:hypothetical protein
MQRRQSKETGPALAADLEEKLAFALTELLPEDTAGFDVR